MPVITYPLNGVTYGAEDAQSYLSTRQSGVYSAEDHFVVTLTGAMQITVSPGLAWMNIAKFKGMSIAVTEPVTLDIELGSGSLPRRDLIVLRFDAGENRSYIAVRKGDEAQNPSLPVPVRTEALYELGLYAVNVSSGLIELTSSNVESLLLDEQYCGLMRDGVTGIPTAQLQQQARELINGLLESLNSELRQIVGASVTNDAASGDPYCEVIFSGSDELHIQFAFHNIEGKDGTSVTHSWSGNVLTITSASGTEKIDFGNIKYYKELVRYTANGTFRPSSYPTVDGKYDFILQGGGGSGAYGSKDNGSCGGESGGFISVHGMPLLKSRSYAVTVGAGGVRRDYDNEKFIGFAEGRAGGATSFAGYTVPGGRGGVGNSGAGWTPNTANLYTQNLGTTGTGGSGGDSPLHEGGENNYSGIGGDGALGSGGGAGYLGKYGSGLNKSGNGGGGVVIICGWVGGR